MKLKNFKPRPMREVEYFGETISIPAEQEWVATDDDGGVNSYPVEPEEQHGVWVVPQHHEMEAALIGSFEPIDENDAIKTLRHYPRGDNYRHTTTDSNCRTGKTRGITHTLS